MRKLLWALVIAAMATLGFASSAEAAVDISKGSSCTVSANWSIAGSVNFNNTSGNPSHGVVDYLVVNSPGPMGAIDVRFYNVAGTQYTTGAYWLRQNVPGYVYRLDPNDRTNQIRRVVVNPSSNTGVYCSQYSSSMSFYSSN